MQFQVIFLNDDLNVRIRIRAASLHGDVASAIGKQAGFFLRQTFCVALLHASSLIQDNEYKNHSINLDIYRYTMLYMTLTQIQARWATLDCCLPFY